MAPSIDKGEDSTTKLEFKQKLSIEIGAAKGIIKDMYIVSKLLVT